MLSTIHERRNGKLSYIANKRLLRINPALRVRIREAAHSLVFGIWHLSICLFQYLKVNRPR